MSAGTPPTFTTLDHIDNITVPGDVFQRPTNEYWALICLRRGMEFLYRQASRIDQAANQILPQDGRYYIDGNFPPFQQLRLDLLTSSFHWYAVSACNYVRTIGAIAQRQDSNRPSSLEYARRVIPEVVVYRNKVSAHFVWSGDDRRDNEAERLASIIPQISFSKDSFYVGELTISIRSGGQSSSSEAIRPWSLCRVHEALRARYWPASIASGPDDDELRDDPSAGQQS